MNTFSLDDKSFIGYIYDTNTRSRIQTIFIAKLTPSFDACRRIFSKVS